MTQSERTKSSSLWDWLQRFLIIISFFTAMAGLFDYTANTKMLREISISAFIVYLLASLWFVFKGEAKQIWKWVNLIALYVITAVFCFWIGSWQINDMPKSHSSNVVRNFSFEDGLPENITLGICDNTPNWYDICYDAPLRFKVVSGGFADEKSLEIQIETLPQKEQVYSLRLPVNPPVFADAVSANVYIPHKDMFSKITLAARIKGENVWIFSDMKPSEDGWLYFLVDTQEYKTDNPTSDIAIDEIHIDIFIKMGTQVMREDQILLDNIELYYPLSRSVKASP